MLVWSASVPYGVRQDERLKEEEEKEEEDLHSLWNMAAYGTTMI